jgi:hypothetical protein
MADGDSYGTKLGRFWAPSGWALLWLAFGLAPLFFFQTFLHEGLHWVTAAADGGDPTLIPFAHFNTDFGRNLNGATMDSPGFPATPQIVAWILLVGMIVVFCATSPPWPFLRLVMTWWFLGLAIDLIFNVYGALFGDPKPGTDWAKFAAETSIGTARALSWVMLLCVLSQVGWIAFARWHLNRPVPEGFFDFRIFAIFLGFVSLIAIIVSLSVDHPAIDRNWWFWMVWTWQLLSLLWYGAYVAWASLR